MIYGFKHSDVIRLLAESSTESSASETSSEATPMSVSVSIASVTMATMSMSSSVVTVIAWFRIGIGHGGEDSRDGDQDGAQGEEELHGLGEEKKSWGRDSIGSLWPIL